MHYRSVVGLSSGGADGTGFSRMGEELKGAGIEYVLQWIQALPTAPARACCVAG